MSTETQEVSLSTQQAAVYLGIKPGSVTFAVKMGLLKYDVVTPRGRGRLFKKETLDAYRVAADQSCRTARAKSGETRRVQKKDAAPAAIITADEAAKPTTTNRRFPLYSAPNAQENKTLCPPNFYTLPQACERLGLCRSYVNKQIRLGALKRGTDKQIGHSKLFTEDALRAFEQQREDAKDTPRPRILSTKEQEDEAVEDGKTSPICKRTGFFVVVNDEGCLRAARVGMAFERGEKALAHFEMLTIGEDPYPRWYANLSYVLAPHLAERAVRLVTRYGGYVQEGSQA